MMVWKVVDRTVLLGLGLEILMGWCSIAGSMARGFARVAAGRLVGDGEYGSKEIGTRSSSDKRLRKWRWRKGDFAAKSGRRHYMRALKISGEGKRKTGTGDGGMGTCGDERLCERDSAMVWKVVSRTCMLDADSRGDSKRVKGMDVDVRAKSLIGIGGYGLRRVGREGGRGGSRETMVVLANHGEANVGVGIVV